MPAKYKRNMNRGTHLLDANANGSKQFLERNEVTATLSVLGRRLSSLI
jgi:hypothetical protein